jgi:GAF domain-containing protein
MKSQMMLNNCAGDGSVMDDNGRTFERVQDQALTTCARVLLGGVKTDTSVQKALDILSNISGIHHAALFEIESYHAEDLRGRWLACASAGGTSYCKDQQDWLRFLDKDIRIELEKGHSCQIDVTQLPAEFQSYFVDRDVKKLLILPLTVCGAWWGSLCIESVRAGFQWGSDLIRDIETVATLLSVYYERQLTAEGSQEREKLSGALEMAGTVCHKLNQPMQVILGYASMVTSGDISEPEQIKEVVQLIEDETRQMGIITKNLMGITKNRGAE